MPLRKASATLMVAEAVALDEAAATLEVRIGGSTLPARLAPSLSPLVVRTAIERKEPLVVVDDGGLVALGALRTSPTPGVDKGDEYVIEARRIDLRAEHRVAIVAGAAQIVASALDYVEILATDITSRARRVHKLVGRMLHLN